MRKITFRGKRVSDGEWVHGGYYWDGMFPFILSTEGESYVFHGVIPETVGQFTGLKDKDGKEIFEGDICEVRDRGFVAHYKYGGYGKDPKPGDYLVVEKTGAGYMLIPKKIYVSQRKVNSDAHTIPNTYDNVDNYTFWNQQRSAQVIGNKWDNPELLT